MCIETESCSAIHATSRPPRASRSSHWYWHPTSFKTKSRILASRRSTDITPPAPMDREWSGSEPRKGCQTPSLHSVQRRSRVSRLLEYRVRLESIPIQDLRRKQGYLAHGRGTLSMEWIMLLQGADSKGETGRAIGARRQ